MKMHDGQVDIDVSLVRQLVATQFPDLADVPVTAVHSTGTVNAIYRLGDHHYARLPLVESWAADLGKEWHWLPRLAPQLSLRVPEPIRQGHPSNSYRFPWAIYDWIEGEPYADGLVDDEQQAARDLAAFVSELRRIDPAGAPPAGRRPLRVLDAVTREAIHASAGVIDDAAATAAWEFALDAPQWTGAPVWIHTDLLRPNVLVHDRRIRSVIDWGGAGIGDPAADAIAAWSVFGREGRATFRDGIDADDGTWNRARGFALHQAAMIIPYYRDTNPDFVASAIRTVEEIVADLPDARLGPES